MYLPCELVELTGNYETLEYRNDELKSCLKWNIHFLKVPKLSKKSFNYWKIFLQWLKQQRIDTRYNIEDYT